jgi:acetolactate synthase-1/2/3 large subunit
MGCAVPLAAGLALHGDRPVVAFVGVAGLEMSLGELATLRDLALPVVVVVLCDDSLALIELKQRRSGLANAGVDFGSTDFAAVARAFGGHGVTVADRAGLAAAAEDAFARPGFTVIAARIGRRAYDGTF